MTEKQLRKQVEKYLKSLPGIWLYHASDRWIKGLPDFIICYKGKFIAIELKREGKSLKELQNYVLEKIKEAGGKTGLAHNLEEVKECMR